MLSDTVPMEDRTGVAVTRDELIAMGRQRAADSRRAGRRVVTPLAGGHASRQHGPGMAFSEVRAYQPGDDIRAIDWRVTARTGRVHSKLFEAERERPVWLGVDLSSSMRFATQGAFKSVVGARAATVLAWEAFRTGERIGAIIWSPGACVELPAGRTRRHLMQVLGALAEGTQAPSAEARSGQLERHASWLRDRARTGSRVTLISDFYDLDDGSLSVLRNLSARCELQLLWIYDRLEADAPPPGRYQVSDGNVTDLLVARSDTRWRDTYRAAFGEREAQLERFAHESSATLTRVTTDAGRETALGFTRTPMRRARS